MDSVDTEEEAMVVEAMEAAEKVKKPESPMSTGMAAGGRSRSRRQASQRWCGLCERKTADLVLKYVRGEVFYVCFDCPCRKCGWNHRTSTGGFVRPGDCHLRF